MSSLLKHQFFFFLRTGHQFSSNEANTRKIKRMSLNLYTFGVSSQEKTLVVVKQLMKSVLALISAHAICLIVLSVE